MREQGRLVEWNDERGFGFVVPLERDARLFAHISEFPREQRRPMSSDLVSYVPARDERNRIQAREIAFLAPAHARHETAGRRLHPVELVLPALFMVALMALAVLGVIAPAVVGLYVVMSIIGFVAYWLDKVAATQGEWRTSEATLLGIAVFGGWPGAYVARHVFSHKTRKQPFRAYFWAAVAVNCGFLVFIVSQLS